MAEWAIECDDVVRTFREGQVRALDGVSLRMPLGQVFGLLGPNGSGKTTIIRILSTVLRPTSGSVRVLGLDVVRQGAQVRRNIGLAGQFAAVDANLSGFENLRMMGRLNHLESATVTRRSHELLEQFGLSEAASRPASTYSGGMRRRLDLAAALVAHPPLLYLDEPTTGLDPQSRSDLWVAIEVLVEQGTTVLLTTQYLEEADRLATQLAVLDHGHVIAEGTPAQLKAQLGTTVLALSFHNSTEAARAVALVGDLSPSGALLDGANVELTVDDGPAAAAAALRRIDGDGFTLAGLALREPSLDDVFLTLTGHKAEDALPEPDKPEGRRKRSRT